MHNAPPETAKIKIDPPEIVRNLKVFYEPLEIDKKPLEPHVTTLIVVSEELTDSSSDALNIPNIYSKETKKNWKTQYKYF